jgi:hypothetical protein
MVRTNLINRTFYRLTRLTEPRAHERAVLAIAGLFDRLVPRARLPSRGRAEASARRRGR